MLVTLSQVCSVCALALALLALACLNSCCAFAAEAVEIYAVPTTNFIARQIRFNFTIENGTDKTLVNQVLWFYAPVKRTATQSLQKLDVSMPYELEEDALGNQIIKLTFEKVAPYATKLVTMKADLLMSAVPVSSELRNQEIFLADEKYLEKDDLTIQEVAKRLKSDDVDKVAVSTYHWVKDNIFYAGFIAEDLGAKYTLVNRRGDCTEYAYLVTALARANGIPARTLGGYVISRNSVARAEEYHNWAELHINSAWQLADAQKQNYKVNAENYVATRIVSQHEPNSMRFLHRFRVDGGIKVRMN